MNTKKIRIVIEDLRVWNCDHIFPFFGECPTLICKKLESPFFKRKRDAIKWWEENQPPRLASYIEYFERK